MSIGSLFSGIGGLDLGAERAGLGPVRWQVEINPYSRALLAKHWPEAEQHEDVRSVAAASLPFVDVICGGFPCQDVSVAGGGAGLVGERSGLWYEYLRILREVRPRGVLIENVPGLVRRGLDVVVEGLQGLGYEVEGTRIRASDLGAWHRRERVFLVAWTAPHTDRQPLRLQRQRQAPTWNAWGVSSAVSRDAEPLVAGENDGWTSRPGMARMDDGVSDGLAEAALGNAVVPSCAYVAAVRLRERLGWLTEPDGFERLKALP